MQNKSNLSACRNTKQHHTCYLSPMNETENTTPEYLSYSQFTTWLACGEQYRLTRILKVDENPAWFFAGGTAIHTAADAIDHQLLKDSQA